MKKKVTDPATFAFPKKINEPKSAKYNKMGSRTSKIDFADFILDSEPENQFSYLTGQILTETDRALTGPVKMLGGLIKTFTP